jgi:AraC family transcriptional regulator, positive regulator of tynA and feaB
MNAVTRCKGNAFETPQANYETWRETFRSMCGRYNPEGVEPTAFSGWVRTGSVFGFKTLDLGSNTSTMRRSYRDVCLDGVDEYFVVFHIGGKTQLTIHNEHEVRFAAGKVILVDAARPMTGVADENGDTWNSVSINLPRRRLVSHLGFDPEGGLCRPGITPAARLLLDLIRNSGRGEGAEFSPGNSYLQLVIYDLVGALFARSDPAAVSRRTDKLFARILGVIRDSFADPDFGPVQAAARAGISLRYLHKLFMERGLTCREFIYSRRLDHAAHLLRRRASLATDQPLSDIAYACGFSDYAHFVRKFRHRYGQPPGAYSAGNRVSNPAPIAVDWNAA